MLQVTTPAGLESDCNSEFGGSPDTGTPPGLHGAAPSPFAGGASLEVRLPKHLSLLSSLGLPCPVLCERRVLLLPPGHSFWRSEDSSVPCRA